MCIVLCNVWMCYAPCVCMYFNVFCVYICIHACMRVCMQACVHACVCMYVCMYTWVHAFTLMKLIALNSTLLCEWWPIGQYEMN